MRELFDTSLVSSMLNTNRDDMIIDQHIGDIMTATDKIGRILLMLYWKPEKFAERYGDQDMQELEDSLRNSFEQDGKLSLFLKQKTVNPDPDMGLELDSDD